MLGELKVLDFGVARLLEGASITGTGELWGTAAFMPPEQALGDRSLDHRRDLWAMGAVVFRLLSGRDVHLASNDHQQMLLAATQPATPLAAVAPQVPGAVPNRAYARTELPRVAFLQFCQRGTILHRCQKSCREPRSSQYFLSATCFVTTDSRQRKLALKIGLSCPSV